MGSIWLYVGLIKVQRLLPLLKAFMCWIRVQRWPLVRCDACAINGISQFCKLALHLVVIQFFAGIPSLTSCRFPIFAHVNTRACRSTRQMESVLSLSRRFRAAISCVFGLKNKLDLLFAFATTSSFGYHFVLKLKDFVLLNNKHWLNDKVLNAFVQLINARCRRLDSSGSISSLPAAIVLNSFFYSKLAE